MSQTTFAVCCNQLRGRGPSKVRVVNDELAEKDPVPENVAVASALNKLDGLAAAPLTQHAAIFEDVRSDLRSALDAD